MKRKSVIGVVVSLLVLGLIPGEAAAHRVTYRVYPVISERSGVNPATGNYDWVGGSLDSRRSRCEGGRTVSLYSVTRGLLATTRTDRSGGHGDWRIDESPTLSFPHTEVYYLTSPRLAFTDTADHRHVCAAARSPNMRY